MNLRPLLPAVALMLTATAPARAQAVLRASPSTRATSEVTLAVPRPAAAMATMPGMAPAPAAAADSTRAATAAMPAPAPLVIRLDYGQPHLRGRKLHTDSLVPYDAMWRTGANRSTTLTTDVDLVLGGAMLAKGTYVLYTLPARAGWKLIVQRSVRQSAMEYSESNDIARIDLRHSTLATPIESFTMWLIPSREPGKARGELRFAWGTDQLSTSWSIQ